jgi:hypothetical protein
LVTRSAAEIFQSVNGSGRTSPKVNVPISIAAPLTSRDDPGGTAGSLTKARRVI